jgi:hypothetical protein
VVRHHKRRGEVALAKFYCSLEESFLEKVALLVCGFLQRRKFPREQTVWCLLRRYWKYTEHLRKPVFCSGGILFTLRTTWVFCTGGILFTLRTMWVFCSVGNHPPRGNPGLKCTRTDTILKKIEFKMNFKLKINVKRDHTNFRSIQ